MSPEDQKRMSLDTSAHGNPEADALAFHFGTLLNPMVASISGAYQRKLMMLTLA
jgi:hypothetical protein